jgi:hypothetical protein
VYNSRRDSPYLLLFILPIVICLLAPWMWHFQLVVIVVLFMPTRLASF